MRPGKLWLIAVLLPLVAGCDSGPAGPEAPVEISVMTRNLYIGTSLDPLLQVSDLSELPAVVAETWANVQATDFPARAGRLAAEVEGQDPDLIGLQEVTLFRIQSPGDFLQGNLRSATDTILDFLRVLLDSLAARGLSYEAVALSQGFDAEAPMQGPMGLTDIRVTDREVILARSGINVIGVQEENFSTNLVASVGNFALTIVRGWVSVDVSAAGRTFRFVSTHLEPAETGPVVQVAQAAELLDAQREPGRPVIFVGDFNSAADGSSTPTYASLLAGGLRDAWAEGRPARPGLTCCQDADLLNPTSRLHQRIDLILLRGDFEVVAVRRLGVDPSTRTASGLWPSDHAGVAARLRLH